MESKIANNDNEPNVDYVVPVAPHLDFLATIEWRLNLEHFPRKENPPIAQMTYFYQVVLPYIKYSVRGSLQNWRDSKKGKNFIYTSWYRYSGFKDIFLNALSSAFQRLPYVNIVPDQPDLVTYIK